MIILKLARRENCPDFENGYCLLYRDKCFHKNSTERDSPSSLDRCNKLIPREEGEYMEWMGGICEDCNELICNQCDVYLNRQLEQ